MGGLGEVNFSTVLLLFGVLPMESVRSNTSMLLRR